MAGPWIFSTLLGLMVVVQLCNTRAVNRSSETSVEKKEDANIHLLRRIMFNVRRISHMLAFQILDEEDQRSTLEQKRASLNPKRKCILHSLILGKSGNECSEKIPPSKEIKSTRRNLDQTKRRSKNNLALNSNSNTNINDNSKNEDDKSLRLDTPLKKKKRNRWAKKMLNESRESKRLRTSDASKADNKNTNKNVNVNLNDDLDGGLNDEDDALNTLSDSDDGPGALNDDFNDALNDESGANDALNDEIEGPGALNDDADGNGGILRDADDGPGALNDEDDGLGALNDEDGPSALNDEE